MLIPILHVEDVLKKHRIRDLVQIKVAAFLANFLYRSLFILQDQFDKNWHFVNLLGLQQVLEYINGLQIPHNQLQSEVF